MEHDFLSIGAIWIVLLAVMATSILVVIAQWRVYEKAGQPGWAVLIPFFNFYILLKIVGKPGWWLLWMLVPLANVIVSIWVTNLLSKSFGKDEVFTIMLLILPVIFYPILGFGKAEYKGAAGKPRVTEINV